MGLLESVVFGEDQPVVVAECRHCGTTVDQGASACPACDVDEIVTYTIQ